jgi:hypothetical protein
MGYFFCGKKTVHFEYISALQSAVAFAMGLFGLGRVSETYQNNYIDSIHSVKNGEEVVAFWVIESDKVYGK